MLNGVFVLWWMTHITLCSLSLVVSLIKICVKCSSMNLHQKRVLHVAFLNWMVIYMFEVWKTIIEVFVPAVLCKSSCIYSEWDIIVYIFFIPRHVSCLLEINLENTKNMGKVNCRRWRYALTFHHSKVALNSIFFVCLFPLNT